MIHTEYINFNFNSVKSCNIFKGFGSSIAWMGYIGKSDDKKSLDFLCDLLFNKNNKNGLHLNFVRYCIGGVEDPSLAKNFRIGGAIEAYAYTGNWDTIDLGQRYFLKKAKELGVQHFEAFANSPPNHMTVSGCTAGSEPWDVPFIKQDITFSNNLKSECIDEFATYLVDVTKYLSEHDNINFTSISPINEALNPGWTTLGSQEGCYYNVFGNGARGKLFNSLRKVLDNRDMTHVDISGYEENSVFFGLVSLVNGSVCFQRFNVHRYTWGNVLGFNTYGFEDSNIFRRLIKWILKDKPIIMSEVDFGYTNGITSYYDFQNVIVLANMIMADIIYLKPEAWCTWQIIEHLTGNGWGALQVDFNNLNNIIYSSKYQCLQMFTHFITPNSILLDLPQLKNKNLTWIGCQDEKKIGLVILSNKSTDITLQFNHDFSNTVISILNEKNLQCDGSGIIKTKILGYINKIVIPPNSLVGISFTILS